MWEAIGNAIKDAFSFVGDAIVTALSNFVGKLLYFIVKLLCYLVKLVFNFFNVFSGQGMVKYDGADEYLINVFFGNKGINNVYWGMALIGFAFIIVFTIISVIKKTFDLDGKVQKSHGAILGSAAKSALTIMLLSAIISATLNMTNILIIQTSNIFSRADTLDQENEMYFTDEQYATMARVLNTIGNYSLNDSYNSRYNLNSCYNSIRQDLLTLQDQGVFSFYYDEKNDGRSWQSMLSKLVKVRDPRYEIPLDDKETVNALVDIMEEIRVNKSFHPISYIQRQAFVTNDNVSLDRVVFLSGTLDSARNKLYNENPSISDACRAPFMNGQLDIYSFDDVNDSFDTSVTGISYILIGIMAWFTFKNIALCLFNCIGRIFNLLGLYVIAPPVVAVSPLDDGAKFKQWISATVVQMFNIFGNIIPMRLVLMFIPIVMSDKLVLFPNSGIMNFLAKALLIIGGLEASRSFSAIITGILSDSAASASAGAADKSKLAGSVGSAIGGALGTVTGMKALGRLGKKTYDKAEDNLVGSLFSSNQQGQGGQGGGQGGQAGGPSKRDMVKGAVNGAAKGDMKGGAAGAAAGAAMGAAGTAGGQNGGGMFDNLGGGGQSGSIPAQQRGLADGGQSGGQSGGQGGLGGFGGGQGGPGGGQGGLGGFGGGQGGPGGGQGGLGGLGGQGGMSISINVLPPQMKR